MASRPAPSRAAVAGATWMSPPACGGRRQLAAAAATMIEASDRPVVPAEKKKKPKSKVPQQLADMRLGFIGWGAMAQAVSLGLVRQKRTQAENVMATDVVPSVLKAAAKEGLKTAASTQELVDWADIVVVAVKPQVVDPVIADIAPAWKQDKILVSICAGVTIASYLQGLGDAAKVVRVMPNTPCLIGQAATAYDGSMQCEEWELELIHGIFAAVGKATHRVPEYLLNAVTALSGSGPAYVYMMVQALSDAGVHGGLPRNVALSLAVQTVIGSAKMVQETGMHPAVLKEAVTSPAGTTIAGVRTLEKMNFNSAIIEAVEAARSRSEELSRTPDFLFKSKKGDEAVEEKKGR